MKKIGFVTKSNHFDSLIEGFRKHGYSASKLEVNSNVLEFDTLVIDLSYPLEKAFLFLQAAKEDFRLSETVIFVCLTTKEQVHRIRSGGLGVDGYISNTISFKDLFQKLKEAHNPDRYLLRIEDVEKKITIRTQGTLSHISETGGIIKSGVTFNDSSRFKIQSKLFEQLKISDKIISKVSRRNPAIKKTFNTELIFSNLSDEDRDDIRKMIVNWSV